MYLIDPLDISSLKSKTQNKYIIYLAKMRFRAQTKNHLQHKKYQARINLSQQKITTW